MKKRRATNGSHNAGARDLGTAAAVSRVLRTPLAPMTSMTLRPAFGYSPSSGLLRPTSHSASTTYLASS